MIRGYLMSSVKSFPATYIYSGANWRISVDFSLTFASRETHAGSYVICTSYQSNTNYEIIERCVSIQLRSICMYICVYIYIHTYMSIYIFLFIFLFIILCVRIYISIYLLNTVPVSFSWYDVIMRNIKMMVKNCIRIFRKEFPKGID